VVLRNEYKDRGKGSDGKRSKRSHSRCSAKVQEQKRQIKLLENKILAISLQNETDSPSRSRMKEKVNSLTQENKTLEKELYEMESLLQVEQKMKEEF